ncbi:expressed unknown protein [Seminavis robusta]|uniref:Uncharacterized protein n=1 Tax=Seminavis robusta TaxID=568900 RepID=A0A9N8HIT8_9STRA|nr:expressed unknown protein [Seminavis robusta]|eukprot:Sro644_g180460.1 n/a (1685) ;mRNA; f:21199-26253
MFSSFVPSVFRRRRRDGGSTDHGEDGNGSPKSGKRTSKGLFRVGKSSHKNQEVRASTAKILHHQEEHPSTGDAAGGDLHSEARNPTAILTKGTMEESGVEVVLPCASQCLDETVGEDEDNVEIELLPSSSSPTTTGTSEESPEIEEDDKAPFVMEAAEAMSLDEDTYLNGESTGCTTGSMTTSDNLRQDDDDDHRSYFSAQSNHSSVGSLHVAELVLGASSSSTSLGDDDESLLSPSLEGIPMSRPLSTRDDDEYEEEIVRQKTPEEKKPNPQKLNCLPWTNCVCENNTYDDNRLWLPGCQGQQRQQHPQPPIPAIQRMETSVLEALADGSGSYEEYRIPLLSTSSTFLNQNDYNDNPLQMTMSPQSITRSRCKEDDCSSLERDAMQQASDTPTTMDVEEEDELFYSVRDWDASTRRRDRPLFDVRELVHLGSDHGREGSRATHGRRSTIYHDSHSGVVDESLFTSCRQFDMVVETMEESSEQQQRLPTIDSAVEDEIMSRQNSLPSPAVSSIRSLLVGSLPMDPQDTPSVSIHASHVHSSDDDIIEPSPSPSVSCSRSLAVGEIPDRNNKQADGVVMQTQTRVTQVKSVEEHEYGRFAHVKSQETADETDVVKEMQALIREITDCSDHAWGNKESELISPKTNASFEFDVDDFVDTDILVHRSPIKHGIDFSRLNSDDCNEIDVDDLHVMSSLTYPDYGGGHQGDDLMKYSRHNDTEIDVDNWEEPDMLKVNSVKCDEVDLDAFEEMRALINEVKVIHKVIDDDARHDQIGSCDERLDAAVDAFEELRCLMQQVKSAEHQEEEMPGSANACVKPQKVHDEVATNAEGATVPVVSPEPNKVRSLGRSDDGNRMVDGCSAKDQKLTVTPDLGKIESYSEEAECQSLGSHAEVNLSAFLELIAKYKEHDVKPDRESDHAPHVATVDEECAVKVEGRECANSRRDFAGQQLEAVSPDTNRKGAKNVAGGFSEPLVSSPSPFISPQNMTPKEKNQLLVRELRHIQMQGDQRDMFHFIHDGHRSESWRQHEEEWQAQERERRLSLPILPPASSKYEFANTSDDHARRRLTIRPKSSRNLVRELKFVQTQGDEIMNSIDDKVKSWQQEESNRQLLEDVDKSLSSASSSASSSTDAMESQETGPEQVTVVDGNMNKSRQKSALRTSGNTESTHSVSESGSDRRIERADASVTIPQCEGQNPVTPISGYGQWHAPAEMIAVFEDFVRTAVVTPEQAGANSDCGTIEITVYSFLRSLASDEEEWTVSDCLEEKEDRFGYFDFDNLHDEVEEEVEEQGSVGDGVNDNVSAVSDLTLPSINSHKVTIASPTEPEPPLRKVTFPKKVAPKRSLPFQQVRLKKSFTNPPRLPQMRQAALLRMYRQQLKHVETVEEGGKSHHQVSEAPWQRVVQRCFSDKPTQGSHSELAKSEANESDNCTSRIPRKPYKTDASKCILDFDWDELDELVDDDNASGNRHPPVGLTNRNKKRTAGHLDSPMSPSDVEFLPPAVVTNPSFCPPTPNSISKSNCYYSSVSVSFLASTLREQTILDVMEEALRILRIGGILNVLDMNGEVMDRIRRQPQLEFLVFQRATAKDQERHETNTFSILEKSGLQTKFDINDSRIFHWTAIKRDRASLKAEPLTPASIEFREVSGQQSGALKTETLALGGLDQGSSPIQSPLHVADEEPKIRAGSLP